MLVLNGLSTLLAWIVHNRPLDGLGMALVAMFAVSNAVIGMWLAWRLMREPTSDQSDPSLPSGGC